jgi:hypothetical protein
MRLLLCVLTAGLLAAPAQAGHDFKDYFKQLQKAQRREAEFLREQQKRQEKFLRDQQRRYEKQLREEIKRQERFLRDQQRRQERLYRGHGWPPHLGGFAPFGGFHTPPFGPGYPVPASRW